MTKPPKKLVWIIGIDEVGRGPLAGPVYVCACAMRGTDYKKMSASWRAEGLNDSKKMTVKAREKWYKKAHELKQQGKVRFAIGKCTAKDIDTKGTAVAIKQCITEALAILALDPKKTRVELDGGLKAPIIYKNQGTYVKGDQKRKIISLASVIAKVSRDAYMVRLHKKYLQYGWGQNKGYGTATHRKAIKHYGTTIFHRKTFLTKIIDK